MLVDPPWFEVKQFKNIVLDLKKLPSVLIYLHHNSICDLLCFFIREYLVALLNWL